MTALVMSEENRKGTGQKSGKPYDMTTLTLIDMGAKPRCKTPVEMMLADDDKDLAGQLEGQTIVVDLTALEVGFQDSIRATGRVRRQAEPANAPATAGATSNPTAHQ